MKFTLAEKDVIDRISILTNKSYSDVKELFQSLYIALAIDMAKGSNEINIPYIGKVSFNYQKIPVKSKIEVTMDLSITPNAQLSETIKQIAMSDSTDCVIDMIRKEVDNSIADQIGLNYSEDKNLNLNF